MWAQPGMDYSCSEHTAQPRCTIRRRRTYPTLLSGITPMHLWILSYFKGFKKSKVIKMLLLHDITCRFSHCSTIFHFRHVTRQIKV
jgi:hypothetical protein